MLVLLRQVHNGKSKCGLIFRKALEVDPGNKRAEEMKTRAQMATTDKLYLDEVRGRRSGGGGGRGGGGRR